MSTLNEAGAEASSPVPFEPDDIPARFISTLAIALTIGVVASVIFVVQLFNHYTAEELKAKGYDVEASAPRGANQ